MTSRTLVRKALASGKAFLLGAGAAYVLDPRSGAQRRARLRRLLPLRAHTPPAAVDDAALEERVRQEVLPRLGIPAPGVQVRVERGVATVRGAVESPALADGLVTEIGKLPGVREVAAMIHVTPKTRAA